MRGRRAQQERPSAPAAPRRLQQRVRRRLGESVGVLDHHDLPATERRTAAAVATTARISATEIDSPSGTTDRTSGWLRLSTVWHAEHSPQPGRPAAQHCRAAASARAATDRPEPGGPVNSQACVIAPGGHVLPRHDRSRGGGRFAGRRPPRPGRRGRPRPSHRILVPIPVPVPLPCPTVMSWLVRRWAACPGRCDAPSRIERPRPAAGQQPVDGGEDLGGELTCRPQPIKHEIASRLGFGQPAERRPHPFVELQRLAFELVGVTAAIVDSARPRARSSPTAAGISSRTVRSGVSPPVAQRESRRTSSTVSSTAGALIGQRRVDVTIGEHDVTPIQGRPDHRGDVVRPVGGEQQRLGPRRERLGVM